MKYYYMIFLHKKEQFLEQCPFQLQRSHLLLILQKNINQERFKNLNKKLLGIFLLNDKRNKNNLFNSNKKSQFKLKIFKKKFMLRNGLIIQQNMVWVIYFQIIQLEFIIMTPQSLFLIQKQLMQSIWFDKNLLMVIKKQMQYNLIHQKNIRQNLKRK